MRTKGEWKVTPLQFRSGAIIDGPDHTIATVHGTFRKPWKEDAAFIALAGTVAHKLDSMGHDGEKAIELLPEILAALGDCKESLIRLPDKDGAYRVTSMAQASLLLDQINPADPNKDLFEGHEHWCQWRTDERKSCNCNLR